MTVQRLILVRHGETDYNAQGRIQGSLVVPLNANGKLQAEAAGLYLKRQSIDAIISSSSSRAVETAEIIAKVSGLGVRCDERLVEINLGQFEGLKSEEIEERHPDDYRMWRSGYMDYVAPDGESRRAVQQRMWSAFCEIVEQEDTPTVLIVSHGAAIRILLRYMFHHLPDGNMKNTSITTLSRFHRVWELESFNETPHLTDYIFYRD